MFAKGKLNAKAANDLRERRKGIGAAEVFRESYERRLLIGRAVLGGGYCKEGEKSREG